MDKLDCFCKVNNQSFRYRACGIIIENGCLLLAKNKNLPYLYSVGGGVHINETAEEAVKREVFEETGIDYEIDRLAYISERFYKDQHRLTFYFFMKPKGDQELNVSNQDEQMLWVPVADLDKYDISPNWFKTELTNITGSIKYIK